MKGLGKSVAMLCTGLFVLGAIGLDGAEAVDVINDTFDIPAGATRIDDAADPLDAAWYDYDGGSAVISYTLDNSTEGIGSDNTMVLEGSSAKLVATFSDIALTNVGDWIKFSYDWRWVTTTLGNIRFGLYNNGGTAVTGDGVGVTTDDTGYWVLVDNEFVDGLAYIGAKDSEAGIFSGGTFASNSFASLIGEAADAAAAHSLSLTITRESATEARVAISLDGTPYVDFVDDNGATNINASTYNEAAIFQTPGIDLRLDNMTVSTNVPEPVTTAMLALGAMALLRKRLQS